MINNTSVPPYTFDRDSSKLRKVPVYNSKTDFSQKSDIFTSGKNFIKNNKKKILLVGSALALLAGIGILFAKRKTLSISHEGGNILSKTNTILKEANEITSQAQKEYDSVLNILNESKAKYFANEVDELGNTTRNFVTKDSLYLMQELNGNKIVRETQFDPDNLEVKSILKNVSRIGKYGAKAKQSFAFNNNKFISYSENISGNIYDTVSTKAKFKKHFCFENGKLLFKATDVNINNEKLNYEERFLFVDDKLKSYEKGVRSDLYKSTVKKQIHFEDNGKISEYQADLKTFYNPITKDKIQKSKISYSLDDNGELVENI